MIGERVTLTREFREDLSEEMTFEQEPEGEGAGHGESGEAVLRTEGSASATTLNLKLTKQAPGTAPLQFCERETQATFSPLTESRLKS